MVLVEFKKINLKAINDALALLFNKDIPPSETTTEDYEACQHRINCEHKHKLETFVAKKNMLRKTFTIKIESIDERIQNEM